MAVKKSKGVRKKKTTAKAVKPKKRGAKLKFPHANDYAVSEPAVMCPAERVIKLYNQETGDNAKRFAAKVRTWFEGEAVKHGWTGVHFVKEVQTKFGSGCILSRPPANVGTMVQISKTTLILM